MLAAGCVPQLDAIHGEPILIETGADAGKTFIGVVETEQDLVVNGEVVEDRRPRRIVRFNNSSVPNLNPLDTVKLADGSRWTAVINPGDKYLTTDFELRDIDTEGEAQDT